MKMKQGNQIVMFPFNDNLGENLVALWPYKTVACLIEVHLLVQSLVGVGGVYENACLRL